MKVIDDRRERKLAIQSDWYRWGIGDWAFPALAIVASAGVFLFFAGAYLAELGDDPWSKPRTYWALAWMFFLMSVPATAVSLFLAYGLGLLNDWDYLEVHELDARVRARKRGWLPYLPQWYDAPLEKVESLGILASGGGQDLKLKITVSFSDPGLKRIELEGHVVGIDRREEALDLLLRLGQRCGCGWYYADADVRKTAAQVFRQSSDELPLIAIPPETGEADYGANRTATSVAAPAPTVAPFDTHKFAGDFTRWVIEIWEPGVKVHLVRPQPGLGTYLTAAGVGAVLGGILSFFVSQPIFRNVLKQSLAALAGAVLGAAVACVGAIYELARREAMFDWGSKQLTLVHGSKTRNLPLADLRKLVLRGLKKTVKEGSGKHKRTKTTYACELVATTNRGEEQLIQSDSWSESADQPIDELAPLAAALSQSLEIDWEWHEYR